MAYLLSVLNSRVLAAATLGATLAACGTPETRCRDGVSTMKRELAGVVGSSEHRTADSPVVAAHTHLDIAQTMLATGNYDGCLENIERAERILNQQD